MDPQTLDRKIIEEQRDINVSGSMFRMRVFLLSELVEMIDRGKLQFVTGIPFRHWSKTLQSRMVENLIMGLPSGNIVIDATSPTWYVTDGAEMLYAFVEFFNNRLPLIGVNFNNELYTNKTFNGSDSLPLMLQRRLTNTQIITTIVNAPSSVTRLWLYSATLIRERLDNRIWKCSPIVYPEPYSRLQEYGRLYEIDDLQTLWQSMIAAFFSHTYTLPENAFQATDDIRFDMFECMLLDHFPKLKERISHTHPEFRQLLPDLIAVITHEIKDLGNTIGNVSSKMKACYAIVRTLVALKTKNTGEERFPLRFKDAWDRYKNKYTGCMSSDYTRKIRALYHNIVKQ